MIEKASQPETLGPVRVSILSFIFIMALVVTLPFVNGCGSTNKSSPVSIMPGMAAGFAFVSNSGSGTVSAFAISSTGNLSPVSSPVASGAGAEFMAMDSVHKFLFVTNQGANSVSAFSVNTGTGMLTPVSGSPFPTGTTPLGIAVDPMGHFVFVANQNDNSLSVFNINSGSGALTPVSGSPFAGIGNPFGLAVSPTGALLFASSFNANSGTGNTVSTFVINSSTGALTAAGSASATSSPSGITAPIGLATDGKFLFVGDHMAESVVSFSINTGSGALAPVSSLPAPAPSCGVSCHHNPLRLTIDSMDRFIYWTNVQAGTVVSFSINNGALTPVVEVPAGQHPFGLALDPSGTFLFVVNKVDNTISSFSVNSSTGMISPMAGSPFAEGSSAPTDIVIVARQ